MNYIKIFLQFTKKRKKGKYIKYIAMLQVVQGTDAYNNLGFATGADCCFLVSSVRI